MDPAKERELVHEYGRKDGNSGSGLFFDRNRIENTAMRDAAAANTDANTTSTTTTTSSSSSSNTGTSGGLGSRIGALFGKKSDTDKDATTTSSRDKESRNYGALGSHKEQDTTSSGYTKENISSNYPGVNSGQISHTRSDDLADIHRSGMTDSIATTGVSTTSHKMSSGTSGLSNMSSRNEHATSNIGSSSSRYDSSQYQGSGSMNQGQDKGREVRKEELIYRATTEEENPEDKRKSNTGIGSSNFSGSSQT